MKRLFLAVFLIFLFPKSAFAASLVVNEFMPHPSSGNDWIEIYNPTSSDLDLTGWTLADSTSNMKTLSGTLPISGFLTFDVSNRLNNGGDSIYLKDTSGNTVDSYIYSSDPGIDVSIGRSPDGGDWATLASVSKGSSNGTAVVSPSPSPTPTPTPTPASSTSTKSTSTKSSTNPSSSPVNNNFNSPTVTYLAANNTPNKSSPPLPNLNVEGVATESSQEASSAARTTISEFPKWAVAAGILTMLGGGGLLAFTLKRT